MRASQRTPSGIRRLFFLVFLCLAAVSLALSAGWLAGLAAQALAGHDEGHYRLSRDDPNQADQKPGDWPMINRGYDSQRFSPLSEINTTNVGRLSLQWQFVMPAAGPHLSTPVVHDGILYVTSAWSKLYALSADTGIPIWAVEANVPDDLLGYLAAGPSNRGVATLKNRIYWLTPDAHLVALDAKSGKVVWEQIVEDYRGGYTMTLAPLVVNGAVIVGTSGGEFGVRGFLAAYDAESGRPIWKTYTIPAPGEAGSETWGTGDAWRTGGGAPWITGSYDPPLNLLYWGTGNPAPPYDGTVRPGANLYTNSMLAVEPGTGKVRWHFQFTPHDVWDFDGANTPILIDRIPLAGGAVVEKALIQANKNGHFYLLDRVTGRLIYAYPLADNQAIRVDPNTGRVTPLRAATYQTPVEVCHSGVGHPLAFSPQTGYAYVPLFERCYRYASRRQAYERGQRYDGGDAEAISSAGGEIVAIDVSTGQAAWRETTAPTGGLLATAGGLVFGGGDRLMAFDARTGSTLWTSSQFLRTVAAPMGYEIRGKQYIAVVSGGAPLFTSEGKDVSKHIRPLPLRVDGGAVSVFALPPLSGHSE